MNIRFKIESTFRIRGKVYVMVNPLSADIFTMESNLLLGGIPIENWITDVNDSKDEDTYIFTLKNSRDENRLHVGEDVELAKN